MSPRISHSKPAATIALLAALASPALPAVTFTVSKTADTNDGICDADCSLREAVRAANQTPGNDTIALPTGVFAITMIGSDELAGAGDFDIQDSVTIAGAGRSATFVDGGNVDRIFHVDPEGDGNIAVILRDLVVRNGNQQFGGAIFNRALLTLDRADIRDSTALNGGCLFASERTVTLLDARVIGCRATTTGSTSNGFGAGIFVAAGSVTSTGSSLTGNQASRNGGAVYLAAGSASFTGGDFGTNAAGGQGGAIEATGAGTTLTTSSSFNTNTANDGGAISILNGPTATVTGATFTGNSATGIDFGGGGAIFNFDGVLNVSSSTFTGNDSLGEGGGAITIGGPTGAMLSVTGSTFTSNEAIKHDGSQLPGSSPSLGGAILVTAGSTSMISGSTFEQNIAGLSGGALYVDQNTIITIADSRIANNVAQTFFGGAILNEGTTTVIRSTLEGNTAVQHSGAISSAVGSTTIDSSTVRGNSAPSAGALGNFNSSALRIVNSTVSGNNATATGANQGFGGGLLVDSGTTATVQNSTFSGNNGNIGGAFSVNGAGATLNLVNATVVSNTAQTGSVFFSFQGTVRPRNSILGGSCNNQGTVQSLGANAESPGNTCGLTTTDSRNIANLQLSALQNNGGPTLTHAPAAGSPVVDLVPTGSCVDSSGATLTRDQRGEARPFDGNSDGMARCDTGSVERQPIDLIFRDGFE